jgi:hypothetical protein
MENARVQPAPLRRSTDKVHTRRVPAMTDEMRDWITHVLDDEYARGRDEGRASMVKGREAAEWVMFGLGIVACELGEVLFRWILH